MTCRSWSPTGRSTATSRRRGRNAGQARRDRPVRPVRVPPRRRRLHLRAARLRARRQVPRARSRPPRRATAPAARAAVRRLAHPGDHRRAAHGRRVPRRVQRPLRRTARRHPEGAVSQDPARRARGPHEGRRHQRDDPRRGPPVRAPVRAPVRGRPAARPVPGESFYWRIDPRRRSAVTSASSRPGPPPR